MKTARVTVVPYDAGWQAAFAEIKKEIESAVGAWIIGVEHVGSTAVEGLSAKPCIDIDVVIADDSVFPSVVKGLAAIGYEHEGDLGIRGREAFRYSDKPHLRAHHLYVCPADSEELRRHIVFRDYLRKDPEAVKQYSRVKEAAAAQYPNDIGQYMAAKAPCIAQLYARCGLETTK